MSRADQIWLHHQVMKGYPKYVQEILGRENLCVDDLLEVPHPQNTDFCDQWALYLDLIRRLLDHLYVRSGTSGAGWGSRACDYIKIIQGLQTQRKNIDQEKMLAERGDDCNFRIIWFAPTKKNRSTIVTLFTEGITMTLCTISIVGCPLLRSMVYFRCIR